MNQYNQTRSFNVGIAQAVGVEAALIYDDLAFLTSKTPDGWVYRTYDLMIARFPFMSERSVRRHIEKLIEEGWISKKVAKKDSQPICHYKIERSLSANLADSETAKMADSMETAKMADPTYINNTNTTQAPASRGESTNEKKQELLRLVNQETGRNFRTLPEKGTVKLLATFSLVEIKTALAALAVDEWHKDKLKSLSIDYFVRATTIDRWLNQTKKIDPRVYGIGE